MKWEIITLKKVYKIKSNSSKDAVDQVRKTDNSDIISVKLLPNTISGKARRLIRNIFRK
jgi:acyl-coenzyme A synthetase/AMP-(fatty) acid ligase